MQNAPAGAEVSSVIDGLLNQLADTLPEDEEVFIIGGSDLFDQWLSDCFTPIVAGRIYLTRVHADIEGDAIFPDIDDDHWQLISKEEHPADDKHAHTFTFEMYDRM